MRFGTREIRDFSEPYILAEIGSNHNGKLDLAKKLIDQAKEAGCDGVKFQSWTKDTIFSKKVYTDNFFLGDDYRNRKDYTLESIVDEYSVTEQELYDFKKYCDEVKIDFSSTPFSKTEVDFLVHELDVKYIKVASMDVNNYWFLDYLARKKKPVVLSTGLSKLSEVAKAVETIEATGNREIVLLHCVSNYPPRDEEVQLNNIDLLRTAYPDYPVGFSDHTIGTSIPIASVAKGVCLIEKHFTLDKNMEGWDHKVSANIQDMKEIVSQSKRVVRAMGGTRRELTEIDKKNIPSYRRSIVATKTIRKGQVISREDLDTKRPGTGIEPQYMDFLVGRTAKRDIGADDLITMEDF